MRVIRRVALAAVGLIASCAQDRPPASPSNCCCCSVTGGSGRASGPQIIESEYLRPSDSRTFAIEYVARIFEVPAGAKKLRIWIPVPQDSAVQTIRGLTFSRQARIGFEPKYGNKMAYFELENPGTGAQVTMSFACTRLGFKVGEEDLRVEGNDDPNSFQVFRKPDTLVLVDDRLKAMAQRIVKERKGTIDQARAIYDYVISSMTYDKNHTGWGLGSTQHACEVGKGNCTDFHALFNSLCRAQGIASGFEIGLYLPYERRTNEKPGGYHCWAFFRVPGRTWVPVDCSEAMRFPVRKEFLFGGLTSNRVTLSSGRDIDLVPRQAGVPLNYFVNPYAEADGQPIKADKTWSFQDLN